MKKVKKKKKSRKKKKKISESMTTSSCIFTSQDLIDFSEGTSSKVINNRIKANPTKRKK